MADKFLPRKGSEESGKPEDAKPAEAAPGRTGEGADDEAVSALRRTTADLDERLRHTTTDLDERLRHTTAGLDERLRQTTTGLDERLQDMQARVVRHGTTVSGLESSVQQARRDILAARDEIAAHDQAARKRDESIADVLSQVALLRAAVERQERALDQQAAIIDTLRAQVTLLRPDLGDTDTRHHHELANQYSDVVTQVLTQLVRIQKRYAPAPPDIDRQHARAVGVSRMWKAAFVGDDVDRRVLKHLIRGTPQEAWEQEPEALEAEDEAEFHEQCTVIERLRAQLRKSRHSVRFAEDVEDGVPADEQHMQLWNPSRAGDPVAFVVAPGYEVAGRVLKLPWVYTTTRPAPAQRTTADR